MSSRRDDALLVVGLLLGPGATGLAVVLILPLFLTFQSVPFHEAAFTWVCAVLIPPLVFLVLAAWALAVSEWGPSLPSRGDLERLLRWKHRWGLPAAPRADDANTMLMADSEVEPFETTPMPVEALGEFLDHLIQVKRRWHPCDPRLEDDC